MAPLKRLAAHSARYSLGSVLVVLGSLLTFPLLTRLLSVEEYGVMSLIASALTVATSVGKLGLQHSTLRFYGELVGAGSRAEVDRFVSTAVLGMVLLGAFATVLYVAAAAALPASTWSNPETSALMLLTSILVFARMVESTFINFMRAEERSTALSAFTVGRKYVEVAAILLTLSLIARSLWGLYTALVIAECLFVAVFVSYGMRGRTVRLHDFSPQLMRRLLAFGVPMLGYELLTVGQIIGDRYLIQHVLGADDLGIYSAAYNLGDAIKAATLAAIVAAVVPMYTRLYSEESPAAAQAVIARFLHIYVMIAALLVGLLAAVGPDLLVVIASRKFAASGNILPLVVLGFVLETGMVVYGAGLYLAKRTKALFLLLAGGAALKLALTYALLPHAGPAAAAYSSIIVCGLLVPALIAAGKRTLRIKLNGHDFLKFGLPAALIAWLAIHLPVGHPLVGLLLRSLFASVAMLAVFIVIDGELRRLLVRGARRLGDVLRLSGPGARR